MTYLKQTPVVEDDEGLPLVPALRTVLPEPAEDELAKQTWKQYFALLFTILSPELAAIALGNTHSCIRAWTLYHPHHLWHSKRDLVLPSC